MVQNPRPCVAALLGESGFADKPVTSSELEFYFGAAIKCGRPDGQCPTACRSDLLLSDDFAQSAYLASQLEDTNTRRRTVRRN